jgi:hypothetical protein
VFHLAAHTAVHPDIHPMSDASATPAEYDVFISYSHKDHPWVSSILAKALRDHGLQVLIDETEFEGGLASIQNMTDAVQKSKRTVAVLTPNWVSSQWTLFEGLLTAQEDPSGARGRLIPILRQKCEQPKWLSIRSYIDFVDDTAVSRQMARLLRTLGRDATPEEVIAVAPAEKALLTLPDLMKEDSAVRDALLEYRVRFENVLGRIGRLIAFKAVHDHLHVAQLRCYDAILRDVPRLASDDAAVDSIDSYAYELLTIIDELRKLDEDPIFESSRLTWVATLQRAYDGLIAGVKARDEKAVRQAARLIDRVLVAEPARIDARLFEVADEMQLHAVGEAVAFVCDRGKTGGMQAEKLAPLEQARDILERLDENLEMLVRSHKLWQDVDVVIRRVDTNIDTDTFELEDEWPELKRSVEALSASNAEWARKLREDEKAIDGAIAEKSQPSMVRFFRRFRQKAATRFFMLDRDLRAQCGELGNIGRPLATIVEALR